MYDRYCIIQLVGTGGGYDAGNMRSWFARIDFYIHFFLSYDVVITGHRVVAFPAGKRTVPLGSLIEAPYSSRVLVLPPHFPLMDTQTDVFFSSFQISWPFVLTSSTAPRQLVLSSFLRSFHPIKIIGWKVQPDAVWSKRRVSTVTVASK